MNRHAFNALLLIVSFLATLAWVFLLTPWWNLESLLSFSVSVPFGQGTVLCVMWFWREA